MPYGLEIHSLLVDAAIHAWMVERLLLRSAVRRTTALQQTPPTSAKHRVSFYLGVITYTKP
jgi:hypothetical protein